MSSTNVVLKCPKESVPTIFDHRMKVRKAVCLNATIVTSNGIAGCLVTDLSTSGCRLQVFAPLTVHQYLALEVQCTDSTRRVQIRLAQVQWTKNRIAGVEFVYLSLTAQEQVLQLMQTRLKGPSTN